MDPKMLIRLIGVGASVVSVHAIGLATRLLVEAADTFGPLLVNLEMIHTLSVNLRFTSSETKRSSATLLCLVMQFASDAEVSFLCQKMILRQLLVFFEYPEIELKMHILALFTDLLSKGEAFGMSQIIKLQLQDPDVISILETLAEEDDEADIAQFASVILLRLAEDEEEDDPGQYPLLDAIADDLEERE
jgi:hypothetical protein